jgi:hypothetical protein
MTKKEFVTMYVLLSESTKSCMTPTEELIKEASNAWNLLKEIEEEL